MLMLRYAIIAFLPVISISQDALAGPTNPQVGCTRNIPVGVPCFCNGGIVLREGLAPKDWIKFRPFLYVRPGWHVTDYKGMHTGGMTCYKDTAIAQNHIAPPSNCSAYGARCKTNHPASAACSTAVGQCMQTGTFTNPEGRSWSGLAKQ